MFRNANAIARDFTKSVVMSRRTVSGTCSAGNGAFVVVNAEGWIVTAAHVILQINELVGQEQAYLSHKQNEADIRADTALPEKERRAKLQALGKLAPESTARAAVWFGDPATGQAIGSSLEQIVIFEAVDLAVAKLAGFNAGLVPRFPKFKSPGADFAPGASLCKLGFPFFSGKPVWDDAANSFHYPPGALDTTYFPMEGIFTRSQQVVPVDATGIPVPTPFVLEVIETSSPGLKGQSGGPMFDTEGNVWALQCQTSHSALGFSPLVEVNGKKTVEHQFINMGMGPSSQTIMAAMASLGIKFEVAP